MNIRSGACEGKQNGRQARQYGCHSNSVAVQRQFYEKKKLVLHQAIAALRQSVGLAVIKEYLSGALTKMSTLMGCYCSSVSKLLAYKICIIQVPGIITYSVPVTIIPNLNSSLSACRSTNQLNVTISVYYKV